MQIRLGARYKVRRGAASDRTHAGSGRARLLDGHIQRRRLPDAAHGGTTLSNRSPCRTPGSACEPRDGAGHDRPPPSHAFEFVRSGGSAGCVSVDRGSEGAETGACAARVPNVTALSTALVSTEPQGAAFQATSYKFWLGVTWQHSEPRGYCERAWPPVTVAGASVTDSAEVRPDGRLVGEPAFGAEIGTPTLTRRLLE